ncbi:MAG TPA: PKD domain-containing protein, partial [Thermoanaerobaculia bacterium]|nr:PKD domain-containing protein [Thermoanaerobaculia bacterium]
AANADGSTCTGPAHVYATPGQYVISVRVTSTQGTVGIGVSSILVGLAVGGVSFTGPLIEGSTLTAFAPFSPFGKQTYTCKVDYGDGSGFLTGTISGTTCKGPSHKYGRSGEFTVTVKVTASKGSSDSSSVSVTIENVAPTIKSYTLPATAKIGTSVTLSAAFTDPGTDESYSVTIDWGDGVRQPVKLCPSARSFTVSHVYQKAGNYAVEVDVSDDGGATVTSARATIGVYDPARSAIGSGSFVSPAGACTLSSKCAGTSTATFSLSAAYAKGAAKPTGSFSLTITGFAFSAASFESYVVQDGVGLLSGEGKVNGVSGYRFTAFLVDGSSDKILVSIADAKGEIVYYNLVYTALSKGSITLK